MDHPLAALRAHLDAHHHTFAGMATITYAAGPEGGALSSPAPTQWTTNHERLAWARLLAQMEGTATTLARLGAPWGSPGFGLHLARDPIKGYVGALDWISADLAHSQWSPHARCWERLESWAPRLAFVAAGPQADTRWRTNGPHWAHRVLHARDAGEAMQAAQVLWSGPPLPVGRLVGRHGIRVTEIHAERTSCSPAAPIKTPAPFEDLDLAKEAERAARLAVRRWDFDDEDAFTTAALTATTRFSEPVGAARLLITPPDAVCAAWEGHTAGTGFDEAWGEEARVHWQAFLLAVAGLPGLKDAPIHLDGYIHAIPGGDTLLRLTCVHGPRAVSGPPNPHIHSHEGTIRAFLADWGPRLAGLASLPDPTSLWEVHTGRFFRSSHTVSAACADSALAAVGYIWGEDAKPPRAEYITRVPRLQEMGIGVADIEMPPSLFPLG